jgi:cell division protein FtsN
MILQRLTGLLFFSIMLVGVFPLLIERYGLPQGMNENSNLVFNSLTGTYQNAIRISLKDEIVQSIANTQDINLFPMNESLSEGWIIQTGIFTSLSNAQLQASGISELGLRVEVIEDQNNFRVWIGPFGQRDEADEVSVFLSSYGYPIFIQEN